MTNSEQILPLNLSKVSDDKNESHLKVSKSSSDLPGQAMFTQQPKISKCGDKLKSKSLGFIKNPTVQINIESQCEEEVATLDSNNNESDKVLANNSKEQKVAFRYKTKHSISKNFQNIPYETKRTLIWYPHIRFMWKVC